jgi:hypothetical protein
LNEVRALLSVDLREETIESAEGWTWLFLQRAAHAFTSSEFQLRYDNCQNQLAGRLKRLIAVCQTT